MHTYAHECTCACMTPSTRWSTETETHNLCRNMHTHKHTHVYKRIHIIYTYTHADMYIYTCPHTYTHTHIYTHTYKMYICTHTSTPWTTARQRPRKELMQTQEALHASCVWRNQSHLAPPILGLHCTHFLRHQYPQTYPRTVRGPRILGGRGFTVPHWSIHQSAPLWRSSAQLYNGPLRSCKQIGGKAAVQQSRNRQARRNPSPRMIKVTVHEKRKVNGNRATPQQPITQSWQRGAQTTSAHQCCGADPPSSWPTHVAGHKGDPPKRGYIFAIFAGHLYCGTMIQLRGLT